MVSRYGGKGIFLYADPPEMVWTDSRRANGLTLGPWHEANVWAGTSDTHCSVEAALFRPSVLQVRVVDERLEQRKGDILFWIWTTLTWYFMFFRSWVETLALALKLDFPDPGERFPTAPRTTGFHEICKTYSHASFYLNSRRWHCYKRTSHYIVHCTVVKFKYSSYSKYNGKYMIKRIQIIRNKPNLC